MTTLLVTSFFLTSNICTKDIQSVLPWMILQKSRVEQNDLEGADQLGKFLRDLETKRQKELEELRFEVNSLKRIIAAKKG